jgi:hypothetical protein
LSPGEKCRSKKGQGERRADGQRSRNQIDHRAGAGFSLFKYCSHSEPGLNCGNPTLRFGEVLDFSLSLRLRHPFAGPAAFPITFKNNAESPLPKPFARFVQQEFSKHHALCFISHVHFIGVSDAPFRRDIAAIMQSPWILLTPQLA